MEEFGETIDIKQFAADLMSLSSGEIEELTKELREHWWNDFRTKDVDVNPNTLTAWAIIAAAKESDKTKADMNLKIAEWFKKYDELERQHHEDEIWMEYTNAEIKFYREFWQYITDKAIGDKLSIIDAVTNNDHNWFEGYVKVSKRINENQEVLLEFVTSKGEKLTATWQPSDNYAVWDTCDYTGDDYSGFLLFPTYKDDEYFCVYYQC